MLRSATSSDACTSGQTLGSSSHGSIPGRGGGIFYLVYTDYSRSFVMRWHASLAGGRPSSSAVRVGSGDSSAARYVSAKSVGAWRNGLTFAAHRDNKPCRTAA